MCPYCGSINIDEEDIEFTFTNEFTSFTITEPGWICVSCGECWTDEEIENIQ